MTRHGSAKEKQPGSKLLGPGLDFSTCFRASYQKKKKKDFRDETLGSRGYNSCTRINHVNNDTLLQMCFITIQGAFIDITSFDPCCSSMRQAVIHHLKNEEFLVSPK